MITKRNLITRRRLLALAGACGLASVAPAGLRSAGSQIVRGAARILVGFPPGGTTDVIARLLAAQMKDYAPAVIVENRPGAGGRVALEAARSAPPDGSVLILTPVATITLYPHVFRRMQYDSLEDFIPVIAVNAVPYVLTIGPMVPVDVKTLADFIAWCRAHPKQAMFGSPAVGSPLHFIGVQLARAADFEFAHVPYQGTAPATQDLLAGQIASTILTVDTPLPYVLSGQLRALITTGPRRSTFLPDVPTIRESGYPELEAVERFGIFVPTHSSAEGIRKLSNSVVAALGKSEVKAGMTRLSMEIEVIARDDFARVIQSDYERWGAVVRAAGFVPED